MAVRSVDQLELPKELLWNLTLRELRGKFKRSALGWLWSVINPLASIAIYSVVFGVFFEVATPRGEPSGLRVYGFFLVCGLLPWTFLANGLNGTTSSIVGNEGLVKKVYFPRWVLPAASTLSWLASYGVELLVLGVVLLAVGNMVLPWVPVVVALMVLETGFVLGLGLVLAAANAYFRDVQHFLAIFLNIWFYATPIIYPPEQIPEESTLLGVDLPTRDLLQMNPMAIFVDAYRDVLYDLRWPTATQWLAMAGVAVGALVVGGLVFRRLEPRLAEEM
ncbi:MAG TPA: ABC transporter permease [Acidimicrobiales bacterium]|nr:ABC transporter permease [Acidimicrobiales bacterium]